jgi:hypothetical protein
LTRRLKAGCVTLRISAAREKFPVLASSTKSESQAESTKVVALNNCIENRHWPENSPLDSNGAWPK